MVMAVLGSGTGNLPKHVVSWKRGPTARFSISAHSTRILYPCRTEQDTAIYAVRFPPPRPYLIFIRGDLTRILV